MGHLPYQLVQDFSHQQYVSKLGAPLKLPLSNMWFPTTWYNRIPMNTHQFQGQTPYCLKAHLDWKHVLHHHCWAALGMLRISNEFCRANKALSHAQDFSGTCDISTSLGNKASHVPASSAPINALSWAEKNGYLEWCKDGVGNQKQNNIQSF